MIPSVGSLTLAQLSGFLRDTAVIVFLCVLGWHARGGFQKISAFFDRVEKHMDTMESFAQVMLANHLSHIEADLKKIVGRTDDQTEQRNDE